MLTHNYPLAYIKKNDVILIENPEAHIHPTGQTKLGYLCAIAAKAGIQLIIESHSDHFFNGVRLALKDGIVKNKLSNILF
ncbi:AAA family ATPase [Enterobacter kobei]|uniref:AAA family ATPase n=1 Tax=Enterobacter kobei TaxID=208224 RepID=UPI0008FF9E98